MKLKIYLSGMAIVASILLILASGCASSSQQLEQPSITDYIKGEK